MLSSNREWNLRDCWIGRSADAAACQLLFLFFGRNDNTARCDKWRLRRRKHSDIVILLMDIVSSSRRFDSTLETSVVAGVCCIGYPQIVNSLVRSIINTVKCKMFKFQTICSFFLLQPNEAAQPIVVACFIRVYEDWQILIWILIVQIENSRLFMISNLLSRKIIEGNVWKSGKIMCSRAREKSGAKADFSPSQLRRFGCWTRSGQILNWMWLQLSN